MSGSTQPHGGVALEPTLKDLAAKSTNTATATVPLAHALSHWLCSHFVHRSLSALSQRP